MKRSFPFSLLGTLSSTFALVQMQLHSHMYIHKLQIKYALRRKQLLLLALVLTGGKWCLNIELSRFIGVSLNWCKIVDFLNSILSALPL